MNGNLKERLLAGGYTVAQVAAAAGTPTAHLYNLLNGVRRPRYALAKRIESATEGLIRWTEFFEQPLAGEEPAASDLGGTGLLLEEVHDVAGLVHAEHEPQDHPAHTPSKPEAA